MSLKLKISLVLKLQLIYNIVPPDEHFRNRWVDILCPKLIILKFIVTNKYLTEELIT